MPWFRRRRDEPSPATRADVARVENLLSQLADRAEHIQHDIAEVNGRLDRSEQGLSTYTYAVRSLSLRLVELDDKLAADGDEKQRAIDDMHGHLRAFETRLPKTRAHDPDDPERPATLEELEDVRLDAKQATVQAAEVAEGLRAELARAMVELQALQARTSPPPPPPAGWRPPRGGTGWTAGDAVAAAGLATSKVPTPVEESEDASSGSEAEADFAEITGAPRDTGDGDERPLHDETAQIPRRDVA